jgi:hypothetical protein
MSATAARFEAPYVESEWRPDPKAPNRQVRGKRRVRVIVKLLYQGKLDGDGSDAKAVGKERALVAERYLAAWEVGEQGACQPRDPDVVRAPGSTMSGAEYRAHQVMVLDAARRALHSGERAMLDAIVLADMDVDTYALRHLRLPFKSQAHRFHRVVGQLVGALDRLRAHWGLDVAVSSVPLDRHAT